ncbi:MAG: helix-turn-helix domain-containing protein [Comamonas sp.]
MKNPRLSISDVALQTGFAENSSFTRWFNAEFQQSPSNWRTLNFASAAVN